ncbi:hypothetical protein B0H13DRAFT_2322444 [Mycena leptocephala]|nr:hypothetical protein B0H13DRAFT_2322444 [Mycena leptocephala]
MLVNSLVQLAHQRRPLLYSTSLYSPLTATSETIEGKKSNHPENYRYRSTSAVRPVTQSIFVYSSSSSQLRAEFSIPHYTHRRIFDGNILDTLDTGVTSRLDTARFAAEKDEQRQSNFAQFNRQSFAECRRVAADLSLAFRPPLCCTPARTPRISRLHIEAPSMSAVAHKLLQSSRTSTYRRTLLYLSVGVDLHSRCPADFFGPAVFGIFIAFSGGVCTGDVRPQSTHVCRPRNRHIMSTPQKGITALPQTALTTACIAFVRRVEYVLWIRGLIVDVSAWFLLSPLTKLGRNSVDTGGDTAPTRHLAVETEMAMLYAIINLSALGVLTPEPLSKEYCGIWGDGCATPQSEFLGKY